MATVPTWKTGRVPGWGWKKIFRQDRHWWPASSRSWKHLVHSNLSRKTIRKHIDNLWLLGGEIIRDLNQTPSLRKVSAERLLSNATENGGPLLYGCHSEEQQHSFDSTCRKLHRYLRHVKR